MKILIEKNVKTFANGRMVEYYRVKYPLATEEEWRDREIALLKKRIARDAARLAELEGQ